MFVLSLFFDVMGAYSFVFDFLFFVMKILFFVCAPFVFSILVHAIIYYIKGNRPVKATSHYRVSRPNVFIRLFLDFPRQYVHDLFSRNPDEFRYYGLKIIDGKQGSGKTTLLTYLLLNRKKEYPKVRIGTNYGYKGEDFSLESWRDLLPKNKDESASIYGRICVIDEIQTWFSTSTSRDFNVEVLAEICQQRKQHVEIFGTTQVFMRLAKQVREQTYILMSPITAFGCVTFVREYDLVINDDGAIDKKRLRKVWFFVHDKELRDAFDTYKKIEKYKQEGFVDTKPDVSISIDSHDSPKKQPRKRKVI